MQCAKCFAEALNMDSKDTTAWLWYAHFLENCGLYGRAEKSYLRSLECDPHSPLARQLYSKYLISRGYTDTDEVNLPLLCSYIFLISHLMVYLLLLHLVLYISFHSFLSHVF